MRNEEIIKSKQVDHIFNEYRIISSINHPFIVIFSNLGKIRRIRSFLWNISPVDNFSRILGSKECFNFTKQRILYINYSRFYAA